MDKPTIAYRYKNGLYLNITNICPTSCSFCIKRKWNMTYRGSDLNFKGSEPSLEEILNAIKNNYFPEMEELVFCGYGEPTARFKEIKQIAQTIRSGKLKNFDPRLKIRLNTNGMGSLINSQDILSQMEGLINSLSISLNFLEKDKWLALMRPQEQYKDKAFEAVLDFIKNAPKKVEEVFITAVSNGSSNEKALKDFAEKNKVKLRMRPELENEN